MNNILSSKLH